MSNRIIGEDNPALERLTGSKPPETKTEPKPKKAAAPKAEKPKVKPASKPGKKETRDIHINLVLKPTTAERLKDAAWKQRRSVNSLAEEIIETYLNK